MTRPIEFRAWDKIKKEMILDIQDHHDCDSCLNERGGPEDSLLYGVVNFGEFIMNENFEIMEFTGLKDKNGVKIWEGDICKVHIFTEELGHNMGICEGEKEFIAQVIIGENGCGVCLSNGKEEDSGPIWSYGGMHEESFEVIGNIHTHRELLKETK